FRMVQILQSIQNFLQWFFLLEVSEPRCIRRTDVDNKIVYIVKQCIETANIVVYSFFVWCRLILAYVPSDNYILTFFQLFQTAGGDIGPLIVEPHPIDQAFIRNEPEHPPFVITRLGTRRHCADLNKAKPEARHIFNVFSVLVKPGSQSYRVFKRKTKNFLF